VDFELIRAGGGSMSVQYVEQDDVKRKALTARMMEGDLTVLNSEVVEAFKIDPHFNVNDIPLDDLDPSHPALFSNDTLWEHFARLRKEDPVHYHKNSIGGAYWSVTSWKSISATTSFLQSSA
jgi:hypothetical protein